MLPLLATTFFSMFFETLRYFLLHICSQFLPSFPCIFLLTPISASLLPFHFLTVIPLLCLMTVSHLHIFSLALSLFTPLDHKCLATRSFLHILMPCWNHVMWVGKEVLMCYMMLWGLCLGNIFSRVIGSIPNPLKFS